MDDLILRDQPNTGYRKWTFARIEEKWDPRMREDDVTKWDRRMREDDVTKWDRRMREDDVNVAPSAKVRTTRNRLSSRTR